MDAMYITSDPEGRLEGRRVLVLVGHSLWRLTTDQPVEKPMIYHRVARNKAECLGAKEAFGFKPRRTP